MLSPTVLAPIRVCPAQAGVYRPRPGHPVRRRCLPRTGGGLPPTPWTSCPTTVFAPHRPTASVTFAHWAMPFAPHRRGSTVQRVGVVNRAQVCPAQAGVYPCWGQNRSDQPCLPRRRGGLPWFLNHSPSRKWFAPQTRGSTRCGLPATGRGMVCPADAGVYP